MRKHNGQRWLMASITWSSGGLGLSYAPIHKPGGSLRTNDVPSVSGSDKSVAPPSLLQRLAWRHSPMLHVLQDLILLVLIGVMSTILAFVVDKSIEALDHARARVSQEASGFLSSYLLWTGSSLLLCGISAACVQFIGPSAAGSGIPQMKCVLAGVQIHDYLSLRTLVAKAASLVLALSGGLSIGKEGPYVHMSSCVAQQLMRLPCFRRLNQNEHLRAQLLASACAAGVSATFGAGRRCSLLHRGNIDLLLDLAHVEGDVLLGLRRSPLPHLA